MGSYTLSLASEDGSRFDYVPTLKISDVALAGGSSAGARLGAASRVGPRPLTVGLD